MSLATASFFRLGIDPTALAAANLARRSPAAFRADWTISSPMDKGNVGNLKIFNEFNDVIFLKIQTNMMAPAPWDRCSNHQAHP